MRSLLFAPASSPDLVAKLPRSRPDGAVIDLEDGVAASGKAEARERARQAVPELKRQFPQQRVYLRVNGADTPWMRDDVLEAADPLLDGVVLPKLERADQYDTVRELLDGAGLDRLTIVAGIESARGVHDADRVLAPGLAAVYFGAEDYIADLGDDGRRRETRSCTRARASSWPPRWSAFRRSIRR